MKIQDHYIVHDGGRFYAVLVVDGAKIESPRFHEKAMAEAWLTKNCDEYRNA